jgi:hypothetical protein
MRAITPQNYSKKIHCVECGQLFPRSQTETLAVGKTVLRLCMKDFEPKRKSQESAMFASQQKAEAIVTEAKENIKKKGKER